MLVKKGPVIVVTFFTKAKLSFDKVSLQNAGEKGLAGHYFNPEFPIVSS